MFSKGFGATLTFDALLTPFGLTRLIYAVGRISRLKEDDVRRVGGWPLVTNVF